LVMNVNSEKPLPTLIGTLTHDHEIYMKSVGNNIKVI
jgi:hypothetical protein